MRLLPRAEYLDKMKAGWIGQMAGVAVGGPTEFRHQGEIVPAGEVPRWTPEMINQFDQDDLYVEMTFLRTLEQHGLGVSARQAGIDFANSRYPLWHANKAGRDLLRSGIAPPDSGHPAKNAHADDIDYQIEADFSGLIAPGLPNTAIALGETFGRLMNAGDGLYGGQFVGAMYAEAFFETDPAKIVEAGLAAIPSESQYHECIADVLAWHKEKPADWEWTWNKINDKYQKNLAYRRFSCSKNEKTPYKFNIDAKLNGAYIVMGLLYGGGDPDRTITIATRCGQDSDCNPANAAGILFTTIGYSKLPGRFVSGLDTTKKFNSTPYTFPQLVAVCEQLADQAVVQAGGRIDKSADGQETYRHSGPAGPAQRLRVVLEPGPASGQPVQPGGDEADQGERRIRPPTSYNSSSGTMVPPGQRDYSSVRLSRHALERFAERFGSEPEPAAEQLRKALVRTRRLGRNPQTGAIAVLALHGHRAFVAILKENTCLTVLTWNQFVPSLGEFGRVKLPRRRGRMLDRLARPVDPDDSEPA